MRGFAVATIVLALIAATFIAGLFASSPVLTIAGFCAWTPAVFAVGFTLARALRGRRLALVGEQQLQPRKRSLLEDEEFPLNAGVRTSQRLEKQR